MSNKKSNHNHKGGLGCVLGLLLKRYHKTSKLAQEYDTQHAFRQNKLDKHLGTQE